VDYIASWAGVIISPPPIKFDSLSHMQGWLNENIKVHCPGLSGFLKRWESAFVQAANDNIMVLSLSFSISEIDFVGCITSYIIQGKSAADENVREECKDEKQDSNISDVVVA